MDTLYRPLKFPVSFIKQYFNKAKYSSARHQFVDRTEISNEYIDFISSLGLELDHAEVFFSVPNVYYPVHRDQHDLTDFPKINFVYGGFGSTMNWYSIKPGMDGTTSYTKINTAFVGYTLDEVELLFQKELNSPSLVQAGVPHNVTTPSNPRWCISTVYKKNNKLLTWDQAIEIFDPYLLAPHPAVS